MTAPKSVESRREQESDEYKDLSDSVPMYDHGYVYSFPEKVLNAITGKAPVSAASTSPVEEAQTPATI
jgi:hypothetical protein